MGGRNRRAGGQHGELRVNVAMSGCLLGGGSGNESGVGVVFQKEVQQTLS